ncbi:MAG: YIP1 family protein [Nitrososphaerales archaeon]|jgi:hypothetical protein
MFCSKCGSANADGAAFCANCGNPLTASSAPPPSGGPAAPSVPEFSFGSIPAGEASFEPAKAISNGINLVKSPANFMRQNAGANVPVNKTILGYTVILAAIPFVATLIGDLWYRSSGLFVRDYTGYAVALAIGTYVLDVIGVFVIGFIIWKLAPSFGTVASQEKSTLLAAFVYTPVFLISIFDIIPPISFIAVLGLLYGLYILYIGLPIMLSTPKDKALVYFVVILVVAFVVYAIIGAILGVIAAAFYFSHIATFQLPS